MKHKRDKRDKREGIYNNLLFAIVVLTFMISNLLFWRVNTGVLKQSIEAETKTTASFVADELTHSLQSAGVSDEVIDVKLSDFLLEELPLVNSTNDNACDLLILNENGDVLGMITSKAGSTETGNSDNVAGSSETEKGDIVDGSNEAGDSDNVDNNSESADSDRLDNSENPDDDGAIDSNIDEDIDGADGSKTAADSTTASAAAENIIYDKEDISEQLQKLGLNDTYSFWIGGREILLLNTDCCVIHPIKGTEDSSEGRLYLAVTNHGDNERALQRSQFTRLALIDALLLVILMILIVNNNSRYRKQIIRIATTDELTGIANRKSFTSEFADFSEAHRNSDMSLFLLDIDFFKQINDNYGHAAGDNALKYLGQQLKSMTYDAGGIAGRWGGDEFIGVLPLPAHDAYKKLDGLCRKVESAEMEDGFSMTISAGVTDGSGETSLVRLTEKADEALYKSKENGRNQAQLFTDDMHGASEQKEAAPVYTAEMAVVEAEDITIEDLSVLNDANPIFDQKPFRERFAGYIREKLIMSTILGVRWMAPFIAGGGILIALAFLFDAASVDLSTLSVAERSQLGSITQIAATLKEIGGITFDFMLPVFAGFMAYGIAGESAFLAGFVGGYMVIGSNSGFAGAMAAGFAAGVITNELSQFTRHMTKYIRQIAPIVFFPVLNILLMQMLSTLVITPIASAIGSFFRALLDTAISASSVSGCTLASMMMAIDMGGIINKVAYNYGVESLASGGTQIMAAVMAGGMVPPIAIFISILLFKDCYTEAEKERSSATLFMGLSFITEGALPYVFTDIRSIIPPCIAGSAAAGMLTALFKCSLPAPHGGIFVFPVMTHPVLYAIAILAGSFAAAGLIGLMKRSRLTE